MNLPARTSVDTGSSAPAADGVLGRTAILVYGVVSYAAGVAALVGMILVMLGVLHFTGGPVRIRETWLAGLFNVGLLVAFGVQHTAMARPAFKDRWNALFPAAMQRPTFVLATGLVLLPSLWLWQPMESVVWSVGSSPARGALTALALAGWAYLFAASFAIHHFELFGLQQSWRGFRGQAPVPVPFRERWMYRFDRHPIMTGLLVGLWATPEMTQGHLLFAAGLTVYVVIGVHFEERSLRRQWGEVYEAYRERVPTIVPLPWSGKRPRAGS